MVTSGILWMGDVWVLLSCRMRVILSMLRHLWMESFMFFFLYPLVDRYVLRLLEASMKSVSLEQILLSLYGMPVFYFLGWHEEWNR